MAQKPGPRHTEMTLAEIDELLSGLGFVQVNVSGMTPSRSPISFPGSGDRTSISEESLEVEAPRGRFGSLPRLNFRSILESSDDYQLTSTRNEIILVAIGALIFLILAF